MILKRVFQKPFKQQMLFFFVPVTVAAVLIIGLYSYFFETNNIKKNASYLMESTVNQTSVLLNDKMMTLFSQMINLSNSAAVNNLLLDGGSSGRADNFDDLLACYDSMEEIYQNYDQVIDSLYFCNNRGEEVKYFTSDVPRHIGLSLSEWMKKYNSSPHGVYWLNDHKNDVFQTTTPHRVISVFRIIGSPESQSAGILIFNLSSSYFSGIFDNVRISQNGYIMLVSRDGTLSSSSMQNQYCLTLSAVEKLKEHFGTNGSMDLRSVTNQKMVVTYHTIEVNGWMVVAVMPESDLLSTSSEFKVILMVLISLLIFVMISLTGMIARSISKPIEYLSDQVLKFDGGDMEVSFAVESENEIGVLSHGLSYLKRAVTELLAQVRREQEQKAKMQLLAMQEQIKPHFLYNTIGSIRQLVNMGKNQMASDLCVELARFYRLGISGGNEIITLAEEIDHAHSYLEIQKVRYEDDFEYEFDIPQEIAHTDMLKLSLQPLIENAIYHGIKKKEGIGTILVSGEKQQDRIILKVYDDGAGMTEDELQDLRASLALPPEVSWTRHFGLRNVNARLKLYFGPESGLEIESVKDVYTQVSILIPLKKKAGGSGSHA